MKPDKQFPLDSDKGVPLSMVGLHEVDLGDFCSSAGLIPAKPKDALYVEEAVCCCATQMMIDGQLYAVQSRNAGCRVHGLDLADKWIPQTHLLTTHESAHATSTKRSSKQKVR